ncbi:MAG: GNAT family N-acetyltransferase [Acidobacteriota bacterium]
MTPPDQTPPSPPPQLRDVDLGEDGLAIRLLDLQRRSYALEAELVGFDAIPPLHESLDELRASPLAWLVAETDRRVLGAIATERLADGVIDIHRLVVDPGELRRGIGRALVERARGRSRAVVSTGRDNHPAVRLYSSLGFTPVGDQEVAPGFWVRRFEHPGETDS